MVLMVGLYNFYLNVKSFFLYLLLGYKQFTYPAIFNFFKSANLDLNLFKFKQSNDLKINLLDLIYF